VRALRPEFRHSSTTGGFSELPQYPSVDEKRRQSAKFEVRVSVRLFDLSHDPGEKHDDALNRSKITNGLSEKLNHLIASGRRGPVN